MDDDDAQHIMSTLNWGDWLPCEYESSGAQHALQDYAATPLASNPASQEMVRGLIDTNVQADPAQADRLRLLHYSEWDPEADYRKNRPSCIRYTIEWKVTLNKKAIVKNTERDVVLLPAAYFDVILSPKIKAIVDKQNSQKKNVHPENTSVVVSVNDRTEPDLNRTYDNTDVIWEEIEEQLVEWGELCRAGKRLRVDLSFNYKEVIPNEAKASGSRSGRARNSATRIMLAERASYVEAEEASTGQVSIWDSLYRLMRCPGPPCDLGPHCLIDSVTKKHRRLKGHHMRQMVEYVQQGGQILTHDDVPQAIRDQLFVEEEERARRHKASAPTNSDFPPITITNVLPPLTSQSVPQTADQTSVTDSSTQPSRRRRLKVFGPRDVALKDFCEWQETQVEDPGLKEDFQKAHEVAMAHALDLELLYEDNDPEFLVTNGLKRGTARHMVGGIPEWVKRFKRGSFIE